MGRKAIASVKQEVVRGNVSVMLAEKDAEKFQIDAGVVFYEFLAALSGEMISSDMMFLVIEQMRGRLLERGYKSEDVDKISMIVAKVLSSRRTNGMHDFMG